MHKNTFFFIRQPDEDLFDEKTGELVWRAYRRPGMSKENRILPIANIGLFVREGGMPVEWYDFPGNRREVKTLPAEIKKIMETFHPGQIALVADRGNYSGNVISTIIRLEDGKGHPDYYILGKGIRQASRSLQGFAQDPEGYTDFQYEDSFGKIKEVRLKARIEQQRAYYETRDGKRKSFLEEQLQIIHFSPTYAKRESHKREERLEKSRKLLENTGALTNTLSSGSLRYVDLSLKDPEKRTTRLDEEKAEKEKELDGYYGILTNWLEESPLFLFREYKQLKFAEADFMILKSFLDLRPVYVRTEKHIQAFFDICLISLVILRILQKQLSDFGFDHAVPQILEGLQNFSGYRTGHGFCILGTNRIIEELRQATGIGFNRRNITQADVRSAYGIRNLKTSSQTLF